MKTCKDMFRAAMFCGAVLLGLATPAFGQRGLFDGFQRSIDPPRNNKQFLFAFQNATEEASKSTVRILCNGKDAALGTVVGEDGWILTKYSQLSGKVTVKLKNAKDDKTKNEPVEATIVGVHEAFDLAMLKVAVKGLTPVKFVDSKEAPVGNWLASAGTGEDPVAVGVMGVAARNPAPSPRDHLNPKRGFLGISMKKAENGGTLIETINEQTPADRAGLKVGDQILAVNGKEITDPPSMQEAMNKTKAGDEVTIKVKRGSEEKEIKVKLGRAPRDQADIQNSMGTDVAPLSERRAGFPTIFQHDSLVPAKDCGGPVVDLDGHVVGINIARAGRTETDAIPSEAITPLLADLESGKLAPKEDKEKKIAELKAALKKAEEDMAAAAKSLTEAQETLKKQEAAKAEAEQKLKEAKEALEKAEKEAKEKK